MSRLKLIAGHRVTKQVGQIVFYLGLSRIISVAGNAWAARCLGPEKTGISTMILFQAGQVGLFVTCGLDPLFMRRYRHAETEEQRLDWVGLVLAQRFLFSIVLGALGVAIAWLCHLPAIWWLGIFAAFPFFILNNVLPHWVNIAQEDVPTNYRAMAFSSVLAGILFFIFFRPGQAAGSDIVVQLCSVALQFYILSRTTLSLRVIKAIRWSLIKRFWPVLSEGRWLFVSALIIYIYTTLEVPMLGYLSTEAEVGKYGVATKLVTSAQQVLGLVPMLLFPRFVEWRKRGVEYLWRRQIRLTGFFVLAGIPACVTVFLVSPWLFRFLYGAAFANAAIPFAILFTSKFVVVLNGVFSHGLWAQAEDRKVFAVLIPTASISFFCNLFLLPRYGMLAACCVNLLSELMVLTGCFFLARRLVAFPKGPAPSPNITASEI